MTKALQIHPADNVAVVLADVTKGDTVTVNLNNRIVELVALSDIPFGHKVALADFTIDQPIVKYGEEIGKAKFAIPAGEWIHLQNVYCERGN